MMMHRDVGLWIVEPVQFQAKLWSEGTGETHVVNFGKTEDIRKVLASYQMYSWEFTNDYKHNGKQ